MSKTVSILLCLSLALSCAREQAEVSRIVRDGPKPYLEVSGKAFAVYGAQIRIDILRNCDYLDWADIEAYFQKAAELGVNTVELSYTWKFLEPEEDCYHYGEIDRMLALALKYGLKVELLWFGSNMIGDSYSFFVPAYVLRRDSLHLLRDDDGRATALYGYDHILYLNDPWLLERECQAVRTLFRHIREWDARHGNPHPVITCQIHNEPDGGVRWRMDQQHFRHRDSTLVTKEEMWSMTLAALDAIGRAVRESDYRVATRTNIIFGDRLNPFPQAPSARVADVYALEGIDFVSVDPYKESVDEIAEEVISYASLEGNYPLVAENRGSYPNTASLVLAASALGGGYCIYDLATSRYITSHSRPPFDQEGIYNGDLTPRPHTSSVRDLLAGLTKASEDVALTPPENFAAFNIVTDTPQDSCRQTICTEGAEITFETHSGALAFVLDREDRLVLFSTAPAVFRITGGRVDGPSSIETQGGELLERGFSPDRKRESTTRIHIGTYFLNRDDEN